MALFFDTGWFDARLAERGISRTVLAAAAGMTDVDVALIFKDQRELSAAEVQAFADLLGVTAAEVADRAGVATPVPGGDRLSALERRVAVLEAEVARLKRGAG